MEFSILTFPFKQIGWGLRQLSLSGEVGNIVAIALYVFVGLIPCAIFLWLKITGRARKIDWMLPVISCGVWYVLYYMINPGLFVTNGVGGQTMILGCALYSVIAGYLVLRILIKSAQADTKALQKGLRMLLYVVMLLFAYVVVAEFVFNLPASIKAVQAANTVTGDWLLGEFGYGEVNLTMTYVFLVLQSVVNALPYVLDIMVLFVATKALKELLEDAYSDAAVAAVQKIADACSKALTVVVIASMGFNVLQVCFRNSLHQLNITATIPVLSLLFIIVILVVARYVGENQKLKQDNDLFI